MKTPLSPQVQTAVLADYATGMSSTQVAAKHNVSANSVQRLAKVAGIVRTHAEAIQARRDREAAAVEAELALVGGRWVPNSRGVQVWRAA